MMRKKTSLGLIAIILAVLGIWLVFYNQAFKRDLAGNSRSLVFLDEKPKTKNKHVHLMHLDGFRSDVFKTLLDNGMLPHFSLLLTRGKISYKASTVDKSETMKVILSYLTSKRDTAVVGWWQFNRDKFQFRNFWLNPIEVLNYALGLEFPVYPTVFDYISHKGETVTAGFSLHRRSVPFRNYSRNYIEGAKAVFDHTYYNQAHATMSGVIQMYEKFGIDSKLKLPKFSTSILAAADEYAHYSGLTQDSDNGNFCIYKSKEKDFREIIFNLKDDLKNYFTSSSNKEICFEIPEITTGDKTQFAHPDYILAMYLVDYEVGRLIHTLRSIRFSPDGSHYLTDKTVKLSNYLKKQEPENSLFENTLFMFVGDHGMVDSKNKFGKFNKEKPDPFRNPESIQAENMQSFISYLNQKLGIKEDFYGIDDSNLPIELQFPHTYKRWQRPLIQKLTAKAERFSEVFFEDMKKAVKAGLHKKYWWAFVFWKYLIDPAFDKKVQPYKEKAIDTVAKIYLQGERVYLREEQMWLKSYYDRKVRLVYGGGSQK